MHRVLGLLYAGPRGAYRSQFYEMYSTSGDATYYTFFDYGALAPVSAMLATGAAGGRDIAHIGRRHAKCDYAGPGLRDICGVLAAFRVKNMAF